MEKLKSCPFCGGEARISERYREGVSNRKMYWVECKKCGITQAHHALAGYNSRAKAANAWNKRIEFSLGVWKEIKQ